MLIYLLGVAHVTDQPHCLPSVNADLAHRGCNGFSAQVGGDYLRSFISVSTPTRGTMHSQRCTISRFLLAALCVLVSAVSLAATTGAAYPSRPIKLTVGYAPASGADVVARLIANELSTALKQAVVVENKPGAGGIIAAQEFVRAPAHGHTLLLAAMPQMIINYAASPKRRWRWRRLSHGLPR
jgi:hypothetical protein